MTTSASAPAVTPALRQWLREQLAAGCVAADILQSMRGSGWDDAVSLAALNEALAASPMSPPVAAAALAPIALPAPDLHDAPSLIQLADRDVQVLMALSQPQVLLFGNLLSHDECDDLVALAAPRMARSETVDHHTGGSEVNAARTSEGMFFERGETPLIERIEARIAALLHWPVDKGEGLQVLRYRPGAQYEPHFDYFDPAQPGTPEVLRRGGQRLATLIMYLNTPERGGATIFPDLRLQVAPTKGCAVFFSYDRPHESTGTLHGGSPVVEGEKWVATKWLREGVFS
jgi:prolyl 4-hydroxylase